MLALQAFSVQAGTSPRSHARWERSPTPLGRVHARRARPASSAPERRLSRQIAPRVSIAQLGLVSVQSTHVPREPFRTLQTSWQQVSAFLARQACTAASPPCGSHQGHVGQVSTVARGPQHPPPLGSSARLASSAHMVPQARRQVEPSRLTPSLMRATLARQGTTAWRAIRTPVAVRQARSSR